MTNNKNGTLYIGVTGFLEKRVYEHKTGFHDGFTKKHRLHSLVYFETYKYVNTAIAREKQLKNWRREWKIALIEKDNEAWEDLAKSWVWDS